MRELPEIETIRRELDKEISGKRVKTVDITAAMANLPHHPNKKHFAGKLEGAKIKGVARKGLALVVTFDTDDVMVVKLGDNGSILRAAAKDEVTKETLVVVTFTQGGQIRLVDATGNATASVVAADDLFTAFPELDELGIDVAETPVSWTVFAELLRGERTKLKAFLQDQKILAGLGDVYGDEIMWAAGLRPDRTAASLTTQEIRRLYRSLVETLHDAIKYRGTSLEGDDFVDIHGKPGDYQNHIKVYQLEKEACRRCRVPIVKMRVANSTSYYCEQCQV